MPEAILNPAGGILLVAALGIAVKPRTVTHWWGMTLAASIICVSLSWYLAYRQGGWPARCIRLDASGECTLSWYIKWGVDDLLYAVWRAILIVAAISALFASGRTALRRMSR